MARQLPSRGPVGKTLLAADIHSPRRRLGPFVELYDAQPGLPLVLRSAGLRQDFRTRWCG